MGAVALVSSLPSYSQNNAISNAIATTVFILVVSTTLGLSLLSAVIL